MLKDAPLWAIVPAKDMDEAKEFFTTKLGLEAEAEVPEAEFLLLKAGQSTYLGVYKKPEGTKAEHTVAGFKVDNIEEVVKELSGKGVVFEHYDTGPLKTDELGIATFGENKSAWFKDPTGNIFAINQM